MYYSTNGATAHPMTADPDAERLILGEMLVDPDLIFDASNKYGLTTADFADSGHAMLFGVLCDMVQEGSPILPSYVRDALIDRHGLAFEEAGSLANLGALPGVIGSGAVFAKHFETLRRASAVRRLQDGVREIFQRIEQGVEDPNEIGLIAIETIRQRLPVAEEEDGAGDDQPFSTELGPEPTAGLGWVATYADTVSPQTSSPRSFNIGIALVLAATAIQGRAKLNMSFDTIRPNLYVGIVGASSVYHKSTALNRGRDVLRRAGLERMLLPESGTSEGLIAALAEQSAGLILRDEVARLLGADRVRYTVTLKADLTDLFGGESLRRRLSGADITVERPYLNILGATTPTRFFDAVGASDWDDGFLVRWLFALPDCEPSFETASFYCGEGEIDRQLNALAQPLRQIAAQPETSFVFDDGVFRIWDTWQQDRIRRAYEYADDTAMAIAARMSTAALKLAMILAAVNGEWGRISTERMEAAIWLADSYRLNLWRLLTERAEHGVSGHKLAKVLQVVNRHGAAGCTRREMMRGAHLKAHALRPVLDKLLQLGAVVPGDDGKRFRAIHERLPVKSYV